MWTPRPRRATDQPAAPAARGPPFRAPRLPADAPAPDGDPKAIQAFIKARGVCFNHARRLQCKHVVKNHHCRHLHNLSAVGNHDENVLHAMDAFEAWTSPAAGNDAAPRDVTDANDAQEALSLIHI